MLGIEYKLTTFNRQKTKEKLEDQSEHYITIFISYQTELEMENRIVKI